MNKLFIVTLWITLASALGFAQGTTQQKIEKLNVIVTDKFDNPIADLKKEEITLLIDGKTQNVASLEKEESPLIYALAVDSSGSMRSIFGDIQSAAKSIVNENRTEDETMLLSFISSDKIKATQTFSSDKNALSRTIDNFAVEGGATAVIDAIYMAVEKVAEYKKDDGKDYRRAVVVITDGEDRNSSYTEKQLFELIKKENAQIFFIGLVNVLDNESGFTSKSPRDKATSFIKRIIKESGGAAILPKKIKDLPEAANQILPLLRIQYSISFTPSSAAKNASRKVDVKLSKESKRKDVKFYFPASIKEQ